MKFIKKYLPLILFLTIEIILYITFVTLDNTSLIDTTYIKYSGIIICAIFGIHNLIRFKTNKLFFFLGSLLTIVSDYFLLVEGEHELLGVLIFLVVQIMYFVYQSFKVKAKTIPIFIAVYLIPSSILIGVAYSLNMIDLLTISAILYFSLLVVNFIYAIYIAIINHSLANILMPIGLILFICCDTHIGICNLISYSSPYYQIAEDLIWISYFPSQVIMQLSYQLYKEKDSHGTNTNQNQECI